jgi:hypothetical protein
MEITNVSQLDSNQFINQDYKINDESLLNSLNISNEFGLPNDKVEVHVISPNGELLNSTYDFRNYTTRQTVQGTSLYNQIELDPKADLESFGINQGQYDITYNFYRPLFLSSEANRFFISDISSDRTEIKISSNNLSYTDLGQSYLTFIAERNSKAYYSDFILNFGDNKTYIGVNVAFDNSNEAYANLYIKLYEPLPTNVKLKDTFWIVESISEPYAFQVDTTFLAETTLDTVSLRGPNINIELAEKTNLTTPYLNLSTLLSSDISSSYQQLQSWLEEKSIEITVDYTDFSNFVHFSSARERLENFKYKLTQIQSLQSDINAINNLNVSSSITYTSASVLNLQNQLNTLIEKFDGYEYFLYYESGSNSWPKTNTTKPYVNAVVTSSAALTWFGSIDYTSIYYGGQVLDADNYDINNKDYVWNNLPEYIKADSQNANLELFTSMLGQHYDYIWTYIKDITDLQVADNRIDFGISKDLVADTLRNFGMKLYTNSRNQEDLYLALLGVDSNAGTLPSTGSYMINNYVTASQYTIPDNDIVKETYKRLYHNLPYLLKTKGTRRGLRALINCFGITDTILKIREYGGNRKDLEVIEQITPKFNYASSLDTTAPLNYIIITGAPSYKQYLDSGSNNIYPDTLEFRFKLDSDNILPTQSILESSGQNQIIRVTYISESYANIDFGLSDSGNPFYSTPITLPLYNDDWWTLNLTRETGSIDRYNTAYFNTPQTYTFTIGNKDSNGIQYLESCSIYRDGVFNSNFINSWLDDQLFPGGANYVYPFTGSIQEFRYWIGSIPINNFKDHILNPQSIVFDSVSGSYPNLIFRAPLGSELDINNQNPTSVHPSNTASFWTGVAFSDYNVYSSYSINYEDYLINTPNIGSFTEIDEKIRVATPNLVPGDVLTPYISIQKPEIYPYTNDLNIVEVAISPQDSINADIIDQLGSFNIDEYIGDPRLASSDSYPALTDLRNFYFKKYSKKENIFDLIKLLSYFDNSLFKMIKDFVPAKANLSTGLVINTNILERNKIARHEPVMTFVDYSGSIETAFITGSNGLNKIYNTAYTSSTSYISGSINIINNDNRELFTGELGGTIITVHTQSADNIVYELNDIPLSTSQAISQNFYRLPLNPTLNNILTARTSPQHLDVDYAYDVIIPVNFNFLSASLKSNLNVGGFGFLNAPVQDSNYSLNRHIIPRYKGSKLFGKTYNTYSLGDNSFGNAPVINLNSTKFAYFSEITSQSLTLPNRVNANIKYLIDSASNITELTEANENLFDVQSIFSSKYLANVSLDNTNQPSKQKLLNGFKPIYAGGFRYEPMLQNYFSTGGSLNFILSNPDRVLIPSGSTGSAAQIPISANTITINNFVPATPPQFSPLNSFLQFVTASLDSKIKVNWVKNTNVTQDIYQKVTGSVTFTLLISPGRDEGVNMPIYYNLPNATGSGIGPANPGSYGINYGGTSGWIPYVGTPFDPNNRVRSIYIPPGTGQVSWDNVHGVSSNPLAFNYNGPFFGPMVLTSDPNPPASITIFGIGTINDVRFNQLLANAFTLRGWDNTTVYQLGDSASLETTNVTNNFNSSGINQILLTDPQINPGSSNFTYTRTPFTSSTSPTILSLETANGLGCEITFNIEGYIKIPGISPIGPGSSNLLDINLNERTIKGIIKFKNEFANNVIRISTPPTTNILFAYPNDPFVFSSSPVYTYDYNIQDNGYVSGSTSTNHYFEIGQNSVNDSVYLTASYDLSLIYWERFQNQNNPIIQVSASFSGYQDINTYFDPKPGDLIRLYNNDISAFPLNYEREILRIIEPIALPISGSYANRLLFETTEPIPPSGIDKKVQNFIFLSKVPDETNVVLFAEKSPGQTSPGILLSEDINLNLKEESGNIIKGLKSQNLI